MAVVNESTLKTEKYCYPWNSGAFLSYSWCGEFTCGKNFLIERVNANFHLLIFTLQGEGSLVLNGKSYTLTKNTVAILPSDTTYAYKNVNGWVFKFLHVHGDSATLCLNETANERGYVFDYNDEGDYFNKLIDSAKNVVSHFVASSQLYSLLLGMRYGETTKIENAEIMQIVRYISDNLNGDLSVQNLASIVNLSRPYFTELFTKTIGKSPYVYVTEERLKKARQLLYTTNKSMGEIATLCGYYDVSSFIRLFKKREGVTPLEFRKNNPL